MTTIAAFIKFNNNINRKILNEKKKVKNLFGDQIYLNHPVHLTLFVIKIKKISDLKKIYKYEKKTSKIKFVNIILDKPGMFFNDPLTNGHTIYYNIKKTIQISLMQMRHLKKINKKIKVLKNNFRIFKDTNLKKNYLKYGFPFTNKIWIPHITIASIKDLNEDHEYIKKFLKQKIMMRCKFNKISFYKIEKNKHIFLFNSENI